MHILFIENDVNPSGIINFLRNKGYKTTNCIDLCSAEEYITGGVECEDIDMIFLDLTMNSSELPENLQEEARKIGFSGWVFYQHIIRLYAPVLYNKTVLYTAYGKRLLEDKIVTKEEYDNLHILHKSDVDLTEKAMKYINTIIKNKTLL